MNSEYFISLCNCYDYQIFIAKRWIERFIIHTLHFEEKKELNSWSDVHKSEIELLFCLPESRNTFIVKIMNSNL